MAIFGIDLGTTYSCIANINEYGRANILINQFGESTMPSVVYFDTPQSVVVGQAAKEAALIEPQKVVSMVKRQMGNRNWRFRVNNPNGINNDYRAQEISALILKNLLQEATANLNENERNNKDVIITCPAYFGTTEKEATKQAGILAGLNVRYILPEPAAAAFAYGMDNDGDRNILVYDLGGGTFDISFVEIKDGNINIICTDGDLKLGGKDWDNCLAHWLADKAAYANNIDPQLIINNSQSWERLLTEAERTKYNLSQLRAIRVMIWFTVQDKNLQAEVDITCDKFNEITQDLLNRTLMITDRLLQTAKDKGYNNIDNILLVGGATYMPQISQALRAKFPEVDIAFYQPNQAVARGAALFGLKLTLDERLHQDMAKALNLDPKNLAIFNPQYEETLNTVINNLASEFHVDPTILQNLAQRKVQNVTSKSFGLRLYDAKENKDYVSNIIAVNSPIPCSVTKQTYTVYDNQTGVTQYYVENTENAPWEKHLNPENSTEIGTGDLKFTRPLRKGSPIDVTFSLTVDGILQIYAKDLTTEQEIYSSLATNALMDNEQMIQSQVNLEQIMRN